MTSLLRKNAAALALLCGAAMFAGVEARAEVSFKGKTIDVIVGSPPGGGTDGTTRLVGNFMEKHLPGNPNMRYRNLPGGHGAKALNYFMKVKPDGLTWAGGSNAQVDPNALRKATAEYNPTKFSYFGGVQRGGSVLFMRAAQKANLTDKSKPPVVVGVIDGDRSWEQMILWGSELLGWNVRFVMGYPGSAMMNLAIRRGETHMMGTSNLFLLKDLFAAGEFVGVAQVGGGSSGADEIEQRSEFGKIPTFNTMVQGKLHGLTGDAFDFWSTKNDLDKWYALPPGTPKEIVDVYRAAWEKMIKDPDFIKQGKQLFSEDFAAVSGQPLGEMIAKTAYPKAEVVAFMDQLKVKNGLPAEPLSDEELAALAKAKGLDKMDVPSVEALLQKVGDGGRSIEFEVNGVNKKVDVSSTRTAVTIGGNKVSRADLKAGVTCSIEYIDGSKDANAITCP